MGGTCCMNGNDRIFWYTSVALYTVCCTYRAAVNNTAILELPADLHDIDIYNVFGSRSCYHLPVIFY